MCRNMLKEIVQVVKLVPQKFPKVQCLEFGRVEVILWQHGGHTFRAAGQVGPGVCRMRVVCGIAGCICQQLPTFLFDGGSSCCSCKCCGCKEPSRPVARCSPGFV